MDVATALADTSDGVLISLQVTPGAKTEHLGFDSWTHHVRMWVTAQPDKGKANKAVVAALKPIFGPVRIVKGEKQRKKEFIALKLDENGFEGVLSRLSGKGPK